MSQLELIAELRSARPVVSPELHERVGAIAARRPAEPRFRLPSFSLPPRRIALVLAPAVLVVAVGAALVGGLVGSATEDKSAVPPPAAVPGRDEAASGGVPDRTQKSAVPGSLRATAPLILLNASLGDQAIMGARPCGCPLEALGWTTHLHAVGSDQKVTAGGMAFLDGDLLPVLEKTLPARLGGGPLDYQLVEEETADGGPRLRLLVDPRVGPLDPALVAEVFFTAIARGKGAERVMSLAWQDGDILRVERRAPELCGGKIRHLRVRSSAAVPEESPSR